VPDDAVATAGGERVAQARQNAVNTINGYRDNVMNNQVPASVYTPPPMTPIGGNSITVNKGCCW
jgi:hypothetical protein